MHIVNTHHCFPRSSTHSPSFLAQERLGLAPVDESKAYMHFLIGRHLEPQLNAFLRQLEVRVCLTRTCARGAAVSAPALATLAWRAHRDTASRGMRVKRAL
jgi:hypothetical protein